MDQQEAPVSMELAYQVEQFYFREARLMNQRKQRQWLETMVHEDVHYWLPITEVRMARDKRPAPTPEDGAIYNDNYGDLDDRIKRLETGLVWMEDPPSKIRHLISNVEVYEADQPDQLCVYSNFHIYRNRRQRDETNLIGGREDVLLREQDGFKILKRKINLDMRVVLDKNLYFFF
ncbi:MAG: 3-phenylpropionate/cinnamic acid dioxygenase subunit beta [Gammaproteobacteria bacterium]